MTSQHHQFQTDEKASDMLIRLNFKLTQEYFQFGSRVNNKVFC